MIKEEIEKLASEYGIDKSELEKLNPETLKSLDSKLSKNAERELAIKMINSECKLDAKKLSEMSNDKLEAMRLALNSRRTTYNQSLITTVGIVGLLAVTIVLAIVTLINPSWVLGSAFIAAVVLTGVVLVYSTRPYFQQPSKGRPDDTKQKDTDSRSPLERLLHWPLQIILAIFLIAAVGLFVDLFYPAHVTVPLVLVYGIIFIIVCLTIASVIFKHLKMSCHEEALGLPKGSIRAIIALSLIIIFSILAVLLYKDLGQIPQPIPANSTILFYNGTSPEISGNVTYFIPEITQAQKDFSLQTLTTISTLVVAIAAFYFGSRAVETAGGALKEGKESLTPELIIKPRDELTLKAEAFPLRIRVKTDPEGEEVTQSVKGDKPETLEKMKDLDNYYEYKPSPGTKFVVIEFALKMNSKIRDRLEITIEGDKTETKDTEEKPEPEGDKTETKDTEE